MEKEIRRHSIFGIVEEEVEELDNEEVDDLDEDDDGKDGEDEKWWWEKHDTSVPI
jgi:hypothetical protein